MKLCDNKVVFTHKDGTSTTDVHCFKANGHEDSHEGQIFFGDEYLGTMIWSYDRYEHHEISKS